MNQFGTARLLSSAVLLPLAWFGLAAYLRRPRSGRLAVLALAALAVAFTHQRQLAIFMVTGAIFTLLVWWNLPGRRVRHRTVALLIGLGAVVLLFAWPYVSGFIRYWSQKSAVPEGALFLVADVFILPPAELLSQPLWVAAVAAGLGLGIFRRRHMEALFGLAGTLAILLIMFTPGVATLFIRLFGLRQAIYFVLALPVGVILGTLLEAVIDRLPGKFHQVALGLLVFAILMTAVEPVPLPWSARDQARAMNALQGLHDIRPADEALLDALAAMDFQEPTGVLAPYRISSFVWESVHNAFVPNTRYKHGPDGYEGASRFYQDPLDVFLHVEHPFLDFQDLAFLEKQAIQYIVMPATGTRAPHLFLDARFEHVQSAGGYEIFKVLDVRADVRDWLFAAMNVLYDVQETGVHRWAPGEFALFRSEAPGWAWLADAWARLPDGPLVRYGQAFSHMMAGADTRALSLWEELHAARPESSLLLAALANTYLHLDEKGSALAVLDAALASGSAGVRAAAADLCFSVPFFYLLSDAQVDAAIAAVGALPDAWNMLYENGIAWRSDTARRVSLLLTRGRYETSAEWLAEIPAPLIYPEDYMLQAGLRLARRDPEDALNVLARANDPDQTAAARWFHADIWQHNPAAALYAMLRGDLAADDPRPYYRQAVEGGFEVAGRVFLARAHHAAGTPDLAEAVLTELEALDEAGAALWAAAARLELGIETNRQALNDELKKLGLPAVRRIEDAPRLYSWLEMPPSAPVELEGFRTEADGTVAVRGLFAADISAWHKPARWGAHLFDTVTFDEYGRVEVPALGVPGALAAWTLYVPVDDAPHFASARLSLAAVHNYRVRYPIADDVAVTLNPLAADAAEITHPEDRIFGEALHLEGYTLGFTPGALVLDLYWRAGAPLPEDYGVFVHLLDAGGALMAQADGPPLKGRYPTSQWRPGLLLRDARRIALDTPLPEGVNRLAVGVYRMRDIERLEVQPKDERVSHNVLTLWEGSLTER